MNSDEMDQKTYIHLMEAVVHQWTVHYKDSSIAKLSVLCSKLNDVWCLGSLGVTW